MNKTLVAALAMLASSSAMAGQPMNQLCQTFPCVKDTNNKIVGVPYGDLSITRQINGEWFQFSDFGNDGLGSNGVFLYQGPNCSGQAYLAINRLMPTQMVYDGSSFFAPAGSPEQITALSYSYPAKPQRGGHCSNQNCTPSQTYDPCDKIAAPARKVETITFYPPFKMQ